MGHFLQDVGSTSYTNHLTFTDTLSGTPKTMLFWLVASTHLKNISQNRNPPQIGVNIKNMWNHHLVFLKMDVWQQKHVLNM